MAKNPNQSDEPKTQTGALPLDQETITYVPGDGDPPSTKMHGLVFHANVPKRIAADHAIVKKFKGDPENGIEAAPNPFFHVGGFDIARHSSEARKANNASPADGPSYRAHVVRWFMAINANAETAFETFVTRWAAEEPLRRLAEAADDKPLGTDDYQWLGSVIVPRLAEMQKAASLNNEAAAEVWRSKGVMVMPF